MRGRQGPDAFRAHEVRPFIPLFTQPSRSFRPESRVHAFIPYCHRYNEFAGAVELPRGTRTHCAHIDRRRRSVAVDVNGPSLSAEPKPLPVPRFQAPGSRAERESRVRFGSTSVSIDNVSSMSAANSNLLSCGPSPHTASSSSASHSLATRRAIARMCRHRCEDGGG